MHYQSRSQMRERDHRISLMPLARSEPAGSYVVAVVTAIVVLCAAYAVAVLSS